MPTVSVIVPCFNQGNFLAETLSSVEAQTLQSWECIIVNDGSTDNTEAVATEWAGRDNRFKYYSKPNGGLSSARNFGLERATGEFIQFLDSDDLIENRKLDIHSQFLDRHADIEIVYGGGRYFDSADPSSLRFTLTGNGDPWMPEFHDRGEKVYLRLIEGNMMPVSSPTIRTNLVRRVGSFDQNLGMFADWDFWIRCAFEGAFFAYLPDDGTSTLIRVHQASMTQHIDRYRGERRILRRKLSTGPISQRARNRNNYLFAQEETGYALTAIKGGAIVLGMGALLRAGAASPRGLLDFFHASIGRRLRGVRG